MLIILKGLWALVLVISLMLVGCGGGGSTSDDGGGGDGGGSTGNQTAQQWTPLPIRSQEEYELDMDGGEGYQHFHSITRSLYNPDYIYATQDIAGPWKSTDGGETWEKTIDSNLKVNMGVSITVDPANPDIVFTIGDNGWSADGEDYQGLYRSTDGGNSWELVLQATTNFDWGKHRYDNHNIAYDPTTATENSSATRWYAAFYNNGLYRSEDSGTTWVKVSDLPDHTYIYAVKTHPTDGETVYLVSDQGFFVSHSNGADLQSIGTFDPEIDPFGTTGMHAQSIVINPQDPNKIFVTVARYMESWYRPLGESLYKSVDGGSSFEKVTGDNIDGYAATRVYMNPNYPDVLYLTGDTAQGLRSSDGGATWNRMGTEEITPFPGNGRNIEDAAWRTRISGRLAGIVPNPEKPDEAMAYANAAFWKLTNYGAIINESSTGFTGIAWSWWNTGAAFDRSNPDRFAFFNCDVAMRITENNGAWFSAPWYGTNDRLFSRWYRDEGLTFGQGTFAGDIHPTNPDVIVASVGEYFRTRLMRTDDGGVNWSLIDADLPRDDDQVLHMHPFISFHPNNTDVVYAGNKISRDGGVTFSVPDFGNNEYGEPHVYQPQIVGFCNANPDIVYAIDGTLQRIIRSDDAGVSWAMYAGKGVHDGNMQFKGVDSKPIFAVDAFDCDKIYSMISTTATLEIVENDLVIYDGETWVNPGVIDLAGGAEVGNYVSTIVVDPVNEGVIYAGTMAVGYPCIFRSTDGGATWEDITGNLPRKGMGAMAVNPHTGELFKGSSIGTWIYPAPQ